MRPSRITPLPFATPSPQATSGGLSPRHGARGRVRGTAPGTKARGGVHTRRKWSAGPAEDGEGGGFELLAVELPAVQVRPRPARVVEGDLPRTLDRARRGHAHQRAVEVAARERAPDDLVLARGEEQRQRGRPLAQVGAGDLARLDRL